MPELKLKFHFRSTAVPEDTFYVLDFKGQEGLSQLFSFDLSLASRRKGLDTAALLQEPAVFTMAADKGTLPFHGVLASFVQQQEAHGFVFYRTRLVPALWRLDITSHNQVFLSRNLQQFLQQALVDGGLEAGIDFSFRLSKDYEPRDYVCQYNESHFAFISRWMEREGLYYYFDQTPQGHGRLVVTDSNTVHTPMSGYDSLRYAPASGMQDAHGGEVVTRFAKTRRPLPEKVLVRDWNYRTPSLTVQDTAQVDPQGRGSMHFYGDHVATPSQAKALAQVRVEELRCREQVFQGESSAPCLRSGFTVALSNHYRDDFNQEYLVQQVEHRGSQRTYLMDMMSRGEEGSNEITYSNSFSAIPASVQFRPQRTTPWPRASGVMHAFVDASGSGKYAELDDQGRYKIRLPFDLSGRGGGQASSWLRMAQPYGGTDHGFHCPLHKETEVILGCVNGDLDRPIILASVPNPETPSQVTTSNQTRSVFTTSSGNTIHFEDKEGEKRILLHTPAKDSYLRMGAPNDPPASGDEGDEEKEEESGFYGIKLFTKKYLSVKAGFATTVILGNSSDTFLGLDVSVVVGLYTTMILGFDVGLTMAMQQDFKPIHNRLFETQESLAAAETQEAEQAARFVEEMTQLQSDITELSDDVMEVAQENIDISEENTELAETKTTLAQEKIALAQQITTLSQSAMKLNEEKTSLCDQAVLLQQANTILCEEATTLCQENTELAATVTNMCEENTELAESIQEMEGGINNLAALIEYI